ncbi:TPA: baseplate hub protein [Klebsiella variicola subsp. variicola]
MTYKIRELTVEFTLSEGEFESGKGNVLTISNAKVDASISAFGGTAATQLELSVWGLSLEYMAKLSGKSQTQFQAKKNFVRVAADGETVFYGTILQSRINLNQAPDAALELSADSAGFYRTIPITPTYVKGSTTVQALIQSICNQAGLKFINAGINIPIKNPSFKGDAIKQISDIARYYNFSYELNFGTVHLFSGDVARDKIIPFVGPDNGLIGYPVFTQTSISFRCMFSSSIAVGRYIDLETSLPNASGRYMVADGTTHYLSSNMDGGLWETFVVAFQPSIASQQNG